MEKALDFLMAGNSADNALIEMWSAVRGGNYQAAMTAQFLFLFYEDKVMEVMKSMNTEEFAAVGLMGKIARTGNV